MKGTIEERNDTVRINNKEYIRTDRVITSIETKDKLIVYVDKDGKEYSLSEKYNTGNKKSISIKNNDSNSI